MSKLIRHLILAAILLCHAAYADTTSTPQTTQFLGLDFTGYLDVSYNYLSQGNLFTSNVQDRVFDLNPNGVTLQQLSLTLAKQPKEGFGGLLNVIIGRDAATAASFGQDPNIGLGNQIQYDINEAFLQYAINNLTIMAGKFVSLTSAESIYSPQDLNFSRSILFGYATPTALTGIRANYAFSSMLNVLAGVVNGWDDIHNWNIGQTLMLGTNYSPSKFFTFALNGYTGKQRVNVSATGPVGTRNLIDAVVTFNATEKLSLVANYDYGTQGNTTLPDGSIGTSVWQGIAAYINYKLNDRWYISLRGEDFDDGDGYRTGVDQMWQEATFTLGFSPTKNLQLRAEARHDFSNKSAFMNPSNLQTSNQQQSFALEAVYQF